jgi:hypothetical protein
VFDATLAVPESDTFLLKLPRISVDHAEVQLPAITFTRDSEFFWILGMNC